ncbi:MAG TPA: AAA domain-containing protein [Pirellulaceae bacterium]|nr:AAA domain-containing protein [Pirellulaceae bacterium]HMO91142.1 AAA domain-containing protein [Pirellulaceae bacterium]HMP69087.1 AAA domain-containing protein [Pirellulaceae bacterium]
MDTTPEPNEDEIDCQESDFVPAHFPVELNLPPGDPECLAEAAAAVRQEYRDSSKWKRLRCEKISALAEMNRGTIFILHVNKSVEFDWTWEGAVAFRPLSLSCNSLLTTAEAEELLYADEVLWRGEVLEVDERNGCLFVSMENPEDMPTTDEFFVRPFEYLEVLDAVFNDRKFEDVWHELPRRLNAAGGNVHPQVAADVLPNGSLPQLAEWWRFSWSVIWGPPGTGKTWTTGQQAAAALGDPSERILIVSTTNKATDAVALSIGQASADTCSKELEEGRLLRIGKGASYSLFQKAGMESMLRGTEAEMLLRIGEIVQQIRQTEDLDQKALLRKQLVDIRKMTPKHASHFVDPHVRVVAATAFQATRFLKKRRVLGMIAKCEAPFTTIFIDEAGLMSRAAISALSLLASRRVVLVGDSKQLAPISRASRVLPRRQKTWLANSGLSHLDELKMTPEAVHVLHEQRRMHPAVCDVVSKYQYQGSLVTAHDTLNRESKCPTLFSQMSRTIWYVLDYEKDSLAAISAERGPDNRSFIRRITIQILEKLFSDPQVRESKGLFIAPFRAQAQAVAEWFARNGFSKWEASTVHSQQGSEATIVIFDTVFANNNVWPPEEWQRLINVGLSRARESVILIASQVEMQEPFLRPLQKLLRPAVLEWGEHGCVWKPVDPATMECWKMNAHSPTKYRQSPHSMGAQIADRRTMHMVLSKDQQRLTNLALDGRPRLVRGVAGSGKSVVLSNWMAKTVLRMESIPDASVWGVYANRSLLKMLRDSVVAAWDQLVAGELFKPREFPWGRVQLLHVREVLEEILPSASLSMDEFDFDYDRAAEEFLSRQNATALVPRCSALFIDEAQDLGPSTLKLLLAMVEQTDAEDPNSRPAHIFYDNAQNIYGRKIPKWSEFGLDMRGRSTILRESYRSTKPITELAVNVLQRLTPSSSRDDQEELIKLGLVQETQRNGDLWYDVTFSQVNGPKPILNRFVSRADEIEQIGKHLQNLIQEEEILPQDICLLYISDKVAEILKTTLGPRMESIGVELSIQKNRSFERRENTLLATTPHSFKGYESEVVFIPCVDQYVASNGYVLGNPLYVAMTRARSLLAIYGVETGASQGAKEILSTIQACIDALNPE